MAASPAGPRLMLDLFELLPLLRRQDRADFQIVLRNGPGQLAARRRQPVDRVIALGRIQRIFIECRIHRGFRLVHFLADREQPWTVFLIHLVHLARLRFGKIQLFGDFRLSRGPRPCGGCAHSITGRSKPTPSRVIILILFDQRVDRGCRAGLGGLLHRVDIGKQLRIRSGSIGVGNRMRNKSGWRGNWSRRMQYH